MDVRILSKLTGGESVDERVPPPRRRWLIRVFLPALILLLTGGLLAYAARDALWPLKPVRVVRVVAKEGGRQAHLIAETATVSVQAPGWIEPDPYPVYITALTNGVIEKVLVLEGESVEAEQVVAEMIDDDARLAVAGAEADLARRMAALRAAQTHWENPVALERAFAVNRAWLTEAKAERSRLDAAIDQEMAKLSELKVAHDRLRKLLPNAAAELEVEQAQYRLEAQRALVVATQKQRPVIDAKVTRYAAEVQASEITKGDEGNNLVEQSKETEPIIIDTEELMPPVENEEELPEEKDKKTIPKSTTKDSSNAVETGPVLPQKNQLLEDDDNLLKEGSLTGVMMDDSTKSGKIAVKLADVTIDGKKKGEEISIDEALSNIIAVTTTEEDIEKMILETILDTQNVIVADQKNIAKALEDQPKVEKILKEVITDDVKKEIIDSVAREAVKNKTTQEAVKNTIKEVINKKGQSNELCEPTARTRERAACLFLFWAKITQTSV